MSSEIDSRFEDVNEKGRAVIISIVKNGGSATTSEIREYCENSELVPSVDNPDINYQVKTRLNDGNSSVTGLEIVRTRTPDTSDSNESKAKIVDIRPSVMDDAELFVEKLENKYTDISLDSFSTIEDALVAQNENIASNSEAVRENREEINTLVDDFSEAFEFMENRIEQLEQRVERLEQR